MKIFINIILILIIALCLWRGCKKGFISGIIALLVVVVSLYGGSILSAKYSHQVVPVLEPFVNGYVDSQKTRDTALEKMGYGNSDLSLEDVLAQDSSLRYDYAYECISSLGLSESMSEKLAEKSVAWSQDNNIHMTEAVVAVLCDTITYVGGLCIAFLLILIILVAITNIGNISFKFPKLPMLDYIGGGILGLAKGFMYCALLCWFLSFLGIVLGQGTVEGTMLGKFFLSMDFITKDLI